MYWAFDTETRSPQMIRLHGCSFTIDEWEEEQQYFLQLAHDQGIRPICLCADVKMTIFKRSKYFIRRAHGSGPAHRFDCPSFVNEDSGFAKDSEMSKAVMNIAQGTRIIRARSETELRTAEIGVTGIEDASRFAPNKVKQITLGQLLGNLYESGGMTQFKVDWGGRRRYWHFEHGLERGVHRPSIGMDKQLVEHLFIPPSFSPNKKGLFETSLQSFLSAPDPSLSKTRTTCALVCGLVKKVDLAGRSLQLSQSYLEFITPTNNLKLIDKGAMVLMVVFQAYDQIWAGEMSFLNLDEDMLPRLTATDAGNALKFLKQHCGFWRFNTGYLFNTHRPIAWAQNASTKANVSIYVGVPKEADLSSLPNRIYLTGDGQDLSQLKSHCLAA